MEIWKIVIILAIPVIAFIGMWYMVWLKWKDLKSIMFVNPKDGHQYMPLYRCKIKCPISNEWIDALIYQDCETKVLYVEDRKDFLDKFVKLTKWENDKGRGSNGLDTHFGTHSD